MTQQKTQWVATLADLLILVNHTIRIGERAYLAGGPIALEKFWVVTKIRTRPLAKNFSLEDMQVYEISKTQVENFLRSQGEALPARTRMFLKKSDPTSTVFDEVWLTDDTIPGSL